MCMEDQGSRAQVRDAVVRAAAASGWDNAGWAVTTYRAMELRRQTFYLWLANVCAVLLVSLLHDFRGIEFYINDSEHNAILTFLALLVAFRSQQAYERWWEGRKLLGSLNNASRSLASLAAAWVTDGNRRDRIIMRTIVFFWSVRATLRRERLDPSEMAGLLDVRQVGEREVLAGCPSNAVSVLADPHRPPHLPSHPVTFRWACSTIRRRSRCITILDADRHLTPRCTYSAAAWRCTLRPGLTTVLQTARICSKGRKSATRLGRYMPRALRASAGL